MPTLSVADVAVADAARAADGEVWSPQLPPYREWAAPWKRSRGYRRRPLGGRLAGHGAVRRGARRSCSRRPEGKHGATRRRRRNRLAGSQRACEALRVRPDEEGYAIVAVDLRRCGGGRACRRARRWSAPSTHRRRAGGAHRGGGVRAAPTRAGRGRAASRDSRHGRAHRRERLRRLSAQRIHLGAGVRILGEQSCDLAGVSPRLMRREYSVDARNGRFCARGRQPVRRRRIVSPVFLADHGRASICLRVSSIGPAAFAAGCEPPRWCRARPRSRAWMRRAGTMPCGSAPARSAGAPRCGAACGLRVRERRNLTDAGMTSTTQGRCWWPGRRRRHRCRGSRRR